MTSFVVLNKADHASQTWRRPADYAFAARETLVPIAAIEAAQAALNMPLAFAKANGVAELVAMLSGEPGRNSFVGSNGRWLGSYVPALVRAFPFRLGRLCDRSEPALCIADDGYLGSGRERIFDACGELSERTRGIAAFLLAFENSRQQTLRAAAALDRAGVLAPWTIKLADPGGGESFVDNMWRVDQEALASLSDETFLDLRKAGALGIAYAQILSTSRLDLLARLARFASARPMPGGTKEPNLDFLRGDDENLAF